MTDQVTPATLPNGLPPPPIPRRLLELLREYPEHLSSLQSVFNSLVDGPKRVKGTLDYTYEVAIWTLEGRLETFVRDAKSELDAANASGDLDAIERAKAKLSLMRQARSSSNGMYDLDEVWSYLEAHKEVLR